MQLVSHTRYSKCPPSALMHAINRLVKLRMESWGKWFQIDWRATFYSENVCRTWLILLIKIKHNTPDMVVLGVCPVNLGAIGPYWWTLDDWRQSTSASIVRCVRGHRLVERWSHLEAVCYSLSQDLEANSLCSIWHSQFTFALSWMKYSLTWNNNRLQITITKQRR